VGRQAGQESVVRLREARLSFGVTPPVRPRRVVGDTGVRRIVVRLKGTCMPRSICVCWCVGSLCTVGTMCARLFATWASAPRVQLYRPNPFTVRVGAKARPRLCPAELPPLSALVRATVSWTAGISARRRVTLVTAPGAPPWWISPVQGGTRFASLCPATCPTPRSPAGLRVGRSSRALAMLARRDATLEIALFPANRRVRGRDSTVSTDAKIRVMNFRRRRGANVRMCPAVFLSLERVGVVRGALRKCAGRGGAILGLERGRIWTAMQAVRS